MTIKMGPILCFHGASGNVWKVSGLIASTTKPSVALQGTSLAPVAVTRLHSFNGVKLYRFEIQVKLKKNPGKTTYFVDGNEFVFTVPGAHMPNMAYASCNGFSALKYMKNVADNNALWRRMAGRHQENPYHLLLLGGDQVYADSMWETVPSLKAWAELDWDSGNQAVFTPQMEKELQEFYFSLYCERWSQKEVAYMLARTPMVAMWDDHDLIDGWGSYPVARQNCDVFRGIGRVATQAFGLFQQQLGAKETISHAIAPQFGFSRGYKIGNLGVLVLDMRSERTLDQVLSRGHWDLVYKWLDEQTELKHMLVMSSIPVVYPGFDTLEQLLGVLPGYQDLEDDLRDHWNSRPHKGERIRLINRLLGYARTHDVKTTILSGDVHVAALGVIEAEDEDGDTVSVDQLIASGIVHPGPNAVVLFCLKHLFSNTDELETGIIAKMIEFPGHQARFIGRRNFLSLEPDEQDRIWANWIVEGEVHPYTKVLHPNRVSSHWAAR